MASTMEVATGRYSSLDAALRRRSWHERESVRRTGLGLLGIALFLVAWALIGIVGLVEERFLPSPLAVGRSFVDLLANGTVLTEAGTTLWRTLLGFAIGAGAGLVAGFAMAMSRYVKAAIYPLFAATFPLPKIALVPLSLVYLGTGDPPIVAVVAVSAFYLVPLNVMAAVGNLETIYRDVARDLQVSRGLYLRTISVPHALPMVLAALRSAWAVSLIVVVGAEMLVGSSGIGYMIWQSSQVLAVEPVFVGLAVIALFGYLSHVAFDGLAHLVTPWQVTR